MQNNYSNIRLLPIAFYIVITLDLLCFIFGISSLLLFFMALSIVIALSTIAIAIVVDLSRGQERKSKKERELLLTQ
jgi:hypothetical protein